MRSSERLDVLNNGHGRNKYDQAVKGTVCTAHNTATRRAVVDN